MHGDEEVAGGASAHTGFTLSCQAYFLTIDNARGHAHGDGAGSRADAGSVALIAGLLDTTAGATAVATGAAHAECAPVVGDNAGAVAGTAGAGRGPWFCATTVAFLAGSGAGESDWNGGAAGGFAEVEGNFGFDVGAAGSSCSAGGTGATGCSGAGAVGTILSK